MADIRELHLYERIAMEFWHSELGGKPFRLIEDSVGHQLHSTIEKYLRELNRFTKDILRFVWNNDKDLIRSEVNIVFDEQNVMKIGFDLEKMEFWISSDDEDLVRTESEAIFIRELSKLVHLYKKTVE